ncbi:hypothetical protein SODALDRAFT_331574 [Sodiomyces alkalinus F11]|uniref:Uncharacterized protein n=1 Tax=Sodiomyces alkalinus (strain CBS 110278 / VKM F-3762 / F11) TaxID=1314773 RepID=A0A3N2PIU4_SODAK|nr:hypothetical protein SODALDRAFT_331574 [Sodiomyces alkalinus F11]ROT34465.1 hypothetical protein SODALDRAFT_331574 [Sodiomyces alkalinus F11]
MIILGPHCMLVSSSKLGFRDVQPRLDKRTRSYRQHMFEDENPDPLSPSWDNSSMDEEDRIISTRRVVQGRRAIVRHRAIVRYRALISDMAMSLMAMRDRDFRGIVMRGRVMRDSRPPRHGRAIRDRILWTRNRRARVVRDGIGPRHRHRTRNGAGAGHNRITGPNASSQRHAHLKGTVPREHWTEPRIVARALQTVRENPDNAYPELVHILNEAVSSLWSRLLAAPDTYIMTPDEFALFNYFQHRTLDAHVAREARRRYWDNHSAPGH